MSIHHSVGAGGTNSPNDVRVIQRLLNDQSHPSYPPANLSVDGLVGPKTIGAIRAYQSAVVRAGVDGRVDPGRKTIAALLQHASPFGAPNAAPEPTPTPAPPGGNFRITYQHGGVTPGAAQYESRVTVIGPATGSFTGSIFPDDMQVKGHLVDGTYDLNLCFHKKNGVPTIDDLIVKNNDGDLRPALTVNRGNTVRVISDNPNKTTSFAINLHNGFRNSRGSDGCVTVKPDEWSRFISIFLNLYPSLADWNENGTKIGRRIGSLVVCR